MTNQLTKVIREAFDKTEYITSNTLAELLQEDHNEILKKIRNMVKNLGLGDSCEVLKHTEQ